ncbi:MAG: GNAT family N-acyltransferase [Terracidiphilus sp.]
MMIADLRSLAEHWNSRHMPPVDVDELLRMSPSSGASRYCLVHEENIASDKPFAQIAIEFEIEQLPLRYGGLFVARCVEIFGPEIVSSLSFVTEHIDLDIGHTKFNEQQLSNLIDLFPESLPSLIAAGGAALDAYAQFLTDCVELAERHCRPSRLRLEKPSSFLSWQLHSPVQGSIKGASESWPEWVEEVRSLRGAAFFDHGRRPHFMTSEGHYADSDPIDLHAWHLLAYAGDSLVGCVRAYPLAAGGPPCLTEMLLGAEQFSQMLRGMGRHRDNAIEIGRWVVDPALRLSESLAPGIAVQLAAGAGALAFAIANQSGDANGVAIFSAGSRDQQYLMLSRLGLKPVSGVDPVPSAEYDDDIRVMYCTRAEELPSRFRRMIDAMADAIGLDQMISPSAVRVN